MLRPHKLVRLRIVHFPWLVCACCGLIALNNPRTAAELRKGCDPD